MGTFFIARPVFAWVLAIVTMLAGAFALTQLPVTQYPDIAPPTIRVSAGYPGATAEAVQSSVTQVIEDGLTGIDGLLYMESSSRQGRASLTMTFASNIDPVTAQSEVQTQIGQIERRLPSAVRQSGVTVTRSTASILMVGALVSRDGRYDTMELGDLLADVVEGPVQRTEGVGGLNIFGSGYAMRIWLDPLALVRFQLTSQDVVAAVEAQNTTVSVGSLGDQPTVRGQQFTATVTAQSQLTSVEDFRAIILRTDADGSAVRLADVARVEIGLSNYSGGSRFNGESAAGFGVNAADGANAVATAAAVRETMDRLAPVLPEGVEFEVAYDTSPFVARSIERVYITLAEAGLLVLVVLLVFLQTWRATIIPMIAVPVVLLGTLVVLAAAGFTINTLTLFALVLSIGLLVDDAIVVVENTERLMHDHGMGPIEATYQSMREITGALVGIVIVLSAVFLPMAFFPGAAGVIYRQFSLTIITAMALSLAVAVILTPALCAALLRHRDPAGAIAPARWFNRNMDRMRDGYGRWVLALIRRPLAVVVLLAVVVVGIWQVWDRLHSSFLPQEDQGVLMARIGLTEGSTAAQTLAVVEKLERHLLEEESEAVESAFVALGWGFGGSSQANAMIFIKLRPYAERTRADLSAAAVARRVGQEFADERAGRVMVNQPPTVRNLGNQAGFSGYLVDYARRGPDLLQEATQGLEDLAGTSPVLANFDTGATEDQPALHIGIDQQKAESLGLSLRDINSMMSTVFAGVHVNDFILGDSLRPVYVQADAPYRMQPDDVEGWYARNNQGEMVPFTAFITTSWEPVAPSLARIDGTPALSISGAPGENASSGRAMDEVEALAAQIPGGYGVQWTGISFQERQSGTQAPVLYALSALIVFLALAALYESWSVPFSVMLSVPVGVLGALIAAWVTGQSDDVYFKVGILTTIGLAARNAILIVEFAKTLYEDGMDLVEAATLAARQRLRPILMTTLTFGFGVMPLAFATGAGAAAQNAIGIAVLGGMVTSTFIAIFIVPSLYVAVQRLAGRRGASRAGDRASSGAEGGGSHAGSAIASDP